MMKKKKSTIAKDTQVFLLLVTKFHARCNHQTNRRTDERRRSLYKRVSLVETAVLLMFCVPLAYGITFYSCMLFESFTGLPVCLIKLL